jgi:hypothetical protein
MEKEKLEMMLKVKNEEINKYLSSKYSRICLTTDVIIENLMF